jgi:hypothetical protein
LKQAPRIAAQQNGGNMKTLFAAVLVAGTLAGFSAADAAGGCGPGYHRGPYGGCRPNGGAVVVAPRVVVPRVVVPRVVVAPAPVVVVPRARVCPRGFVWRYGRCRVI